MSSTAIRGVSKIVVAKGLLGKKTSVVGSLNRYSIYLERKPNVLEVLPDPVPGTTMLTFLVGHPQPKSLTSTFHNRETEEHPFNLQSF